MVEARKQKIEKMQLESLKFLALGGEEDVTRNMYLYEFQDQILIVDCGLGFPDETMFGVDLYRNCRRFLCTDHRSPLPSPMTNWPNSNSSRLSRRFSLLTVSFSSVLL